MTLDQVIKIISTLGFPMAVAIFLLWERYKFYGLIVEHQAREFEVLTEIRDAVRARL